MDIQQGAVKKVQTQFRNFPLASLQKSSGRIFTIYASRNDATSCEVQTHFGGFHLARYITKVLGALSRSLRPQTKLFGMKFRRILEVFSVQAL